MEEMKSSIASWSCSHQRVFVRADLNVPLVDGKIENDRRLQAIQKTLDTLIKKDAIIILASHIGRPKKPNPELSTKTLRDWFDQHGYRTIYCKDPEVVRAQTNVSPGTILLLENLRFFPGEKERDPAFVKELRSLADWYVNDAFATLHRSDASLSDLAYKFEKDHRSIGYLIQDELHMLNTFIQGAHAPKTVILGGGKISDKLPVIEHLLETVDYILLCPAIVFTFLKSLGKPVGKSLVEPDALEKARRILQKTSSCEDKLVFPLDYLVATSSLEGPLSFVEAEAFPEDAIGISIGPKTVQLYSRFIQQSNSIFYNGMMGFPNRKDTLEGIKKLFVAISDAPGISIIAGGDSIAVADSLHLSGITYYSTGGGATLTYLSGKPLAGLKPFLEDRTESNKT